MDVFLFPLVNVTLFPRTTKPLNIFEPRYIDMVRDAIATRTPIALGFIEDPLDVVPVGVGDRVPFVREIAGYGFAQIIEERPNGTLLVFLQGEGKCKIGRVKSSTSVLRCEAEPVAETLVVTSEVAPQIHTLTKILVRWIGVHLPDPAQREMFLRNLNGPEEIVGAFAAHLIRDYDLQQMVLEFNTMEEKIRFLHRLAESNEIAE